MFSIIAVSISIPTNSVSVFCNFLTEKHKLTFSPTEWNFWLMPFWPVWSDTLLQFDLCFSNNYWCWVSFHVFVSHLYVSLEKCLFRSAHFFDWIFFLFLYILEINAFSVVSFANIFSHSEGCLFFFLVDGFLCYVKAFMFN